MHNTCTEIFTKNVYTVSNTWCMAQHMCDSVLVLTASCNNSTTPYEDELTQKGLTELGTVPTRCWKDSGQSSYTV